MEKKPSRERKPSREKKAEEDPLTRCRTPWAA